MKWTNEPNRIGWYIWIAKQFWYDTEAVYWNGEYITSWDEEAYEPEKFYPPFNKEVCRFLFLGKEVLEWKEPDDEY